MLFESLKEEIWQKLLITIVFKIELKSFFLKAKQIQILYCYLPISPKQLLKVYLIIIFHMVGSSYVNTQTSQIGYGKILIKDKL